MPPEAKPGQQEQGAVLKGGDWPLDIGREWTSPYVPLFVSRLPFSAGPASCVVWTFLGFRCTFEAETSLWAPM